MLTLSTCESEGYEGYEGYEGHEGCQRCEGESGPSGPSGPSGVRPHRQVGASKLGWRARTRAAQYCHGFFNGAGKVHISQSDCKAEITARLEFKAALLVFEDLYGGLRRTQGSQGTPALKWTWEMQADVGPFFETSRVSRVSWEFLAGLFDAVARIRVIQGEIIVEMSHRSLSLLESVRHFLLDTLQEEENMDRATIDSAIILHDFHRRNRLVVCSNLSRLVLQKLRKSLKVRRPAVEFLMSSLSTRNLADLRLIRLIASAQGAHLESNSQGKLRVVPNSQSFKRHLEFQARQEDAKEIRHLLELETLRS